MQVSQLEPIPIHNAQKSLFAGEEVLELQIEESGKTRSGAVSNGLLMKSVLTVLSSLVLMVFISYNHG